MFGIRICKENGYLRLTVIVAQKGDVLSAASAVKEGTRGSIG